MKYWSGFALTILLACLAGGTTASAQQQPWSVRAANTAMSRWPNGVFSPAGAPPKWTPGEGVTLEGIYAVWQNTVNRSDFYYLEHAVDPLIGPDGSVPALKNSAMRLNEIQLGLPLMALYGESLNKRYYTAATALYDQLQHQPQNASGGFWTSQKHPNQMTLENIDEVEPFYAEYARMFHHPQAFSQITNQFVLMQMHTRDPRTGLLVQGWDESKQAVWANKQTGESAEPWARGMGLYMMALVDTIPLYPADDPGRMVLISILREDAAAVARYQDAKTGLWYQVMDKAGAKGNFPEESASCMFVYALAKGVRRGYLQESYDAVAERGYDGILSHFVTTGANGEVSVSGIAGLARLGANPQANGSYAFYTGEKTASNTPMGVGAFILASAEAEHIESAKLGRGDDVLLDAWFNSQKRRDVTGRMVYFHYKWNDQSIEGYSLFGHIFRNDGARTTTLYTEPTYEKLKHAQVYIIASPDNIAKNPHPHFANAEDAAQIAKWVKAGGVLVIFENDTGYADLKHFNVVPEKFGIHFNSVLAMHVIGEDWAMGRFHLSGKGPIFHHPLTCYVKDTSTISVSGPAKAVYTHDGDILMAVARYGKGTVYAMVDPWVYNEYTNGLKLPATYQNYAAGEALAKWVLQQVPKQTAN